jgi:hypothetical protein
MSAGRPCTHEDREADALSAEREIARIVLDESTPDLVRAAILFRVGATLASPRLAYLDLREIR